MTPRRLVDGYRRFGATFFMLFYSNIFLVFMTG